MLLSEVQKQIDDISLTKHLQLVNYVRMHHHSYELAEDCVQEAYIEAIVSADKIHSPDKLFSWLKTVALRKAQKNLKEYLQIIDACFQTGYINELEQPNRIEQIVIADAVSHVLAKFPLHYTDILRLRYLEGYSFKQIGEKLNIQPAAIRQAHFRIKVALRQEFKDIDN